MKLLRESRLEAGHLSVGLYPLNHHRLWKLPSGSLQEVAKWRSRNRVMCCPVNHHGRLTIAFSPAWISSFPQEELRNWRIKWEGLWLCVKDGGREHWLCIIFRFTYWNAPLCRTKSRHFNACYLVLCSQNPRSLSCVDFPDVETQMKRCKMISKDHT